MRKTIRLLAVIAIIIFALSFVINLSVGIVTVARPDLVNEKTILDLARRYGVHAADMDDLTLICGLITLLLGAFSIAPLGLAIASIAISYKCQKRRVFVTIGVLEIICLSLPIGVFLILVALFDCKK